jgi:hypothetical protein
MPAIHRNLPQQSIFRIQILTEMLPGAWQIAESAAATGSFSGCPCPLTNCTMKHRRAS